MTRRITAFIAIGILAAWAMPALAQEKSDTDDLRQQIEALRKEVQELREWKSQVEAESRDVVESAPSPLLDQMDDVLAMEDDDPGIIRLPRSLNLKITGELRTRYEYKWNLYSPSDPEGDRSFDFAHMRTRLRTDFEVDDNIEAVIEFQDVRTFGEEGSTTADTEGVDLKRGEMILSNLFDRPMELEVGRFVLYYGDQRLIGHLEWVDQGRTYDGFRLSYGPEGYFTDIFGVRIRDDAVGLVDEQDLLGLYAGIHDIVPSVTAEGYALLLNDTEDRMGETDVGDTQFVTVGTRLDGASEGFNYTGEIALQTGRVNDDSLEAWAFAVKGGYTFEDVDMQPHFGVEVDYASGNDDLTDGDTETFQTLFPTNHLHYGYADIVAWSNIWVLKGGASVKPRPDVDLAVDYYYFQLDEPEGGWFNAGGVPIRPGDPDADDDLGQEIDVTLKWKATKNLSLLAGWAHFIAGDFVKDTGDDPDADYVYVQAHLKF